MLLPLLMNLAMFGTVAGESSNGTSGGGHYTPARHFTPQPPKKKRIDKVLKEELRLRVAIHEVQDSGTDLLILENLNRQLQELQKLILMYALESSAAYDYIQLKRQEEDDEVSEILQFL